MMIIFLAIILFAYNNKLQSTLSENTCNTLEEIIEQQKFGFEKNIAGEKTMLESFAFLIAEGEQDETSIVKSLEFIKNQHIFEYMAVIDLDGNGVLNDGSHLNFSDRAYLKEVLEGKTVISELRRSQVNPALNVVVLATPIRQNEEIVGVLIGAYNSRKLDQIFLSAFNDQGYAYITDRGGNIVTRTASTHDLSSYSNIFDILREGNFYDYDDFFTLQEKTVAGNDKGHAKYEIAGKKFLLHYNKTGVNDWQIFSIVPEKVFVQNTNKILLWAVFITGVLLLIVAGQGIYVYKMQQSYIEELYHGAFIDDLTGRANFKKFKLEAELLLKSIVGTKKKYTIIKLDVDRFKLINNIYGHAIGDKILQIISDGIANLIDKQKGIFTRITSDEFLLLLEYDNQDEIKMERAEFEKFVTERVGKIIDFKMRMPEGRYSIPNGETDITSIFEKVNFAHRLAKTSDKTTCFYNEKIKLVAIKEKEIENKMETSLLNNEFHVFLQPKYRLTDETIIGAEALCRWKVEDDVFISPGVFIPLFEQNGFITKLDFYMFEETCKNLRKWIDAGIEPVTISVNFSRLHLTNKDFVDKLSEVADKYSIPHNLLEIEITETVIFDNIKILSNVLERLHQKNFTLSMDDFGSGYSSLGLLKNLSVDVIKIDREFFDASDSPARDKAVIGGVINMAKSLKIETVAEGVETKHYIDLLKELNCDIVQGFYYSKPLPLEEFLEELKKKPKNI